MASFNITANQWVQIYIGGSSLVDQTIAVTAGKALISLGTPSDATTAIDSSSFDDKVIYVPAATSIYARLNGGSLATVTTGNYGAGQSVAGYELARAANTLQGVGPSPVSYGAQIGDSHANKDFNGGNRVTSLVANTTAGSNALVVTQSSNPLATVYNGMPISGAGIPTGTTIASGGPGTTGTYQMSQQATATATGVAVTATSSLITPLPQVQKQASGYGTIALMLSGQRVRMPTQTNVWAFPGQETSVILAQLPAFLAQMPVKPSVMTVDCGTNNVYHDAAGTGVGSFASITGDWKSIAAYNAGLGIRTIFLPIGPRGAGFTPLFSAAQFDVIDRCNRWLAQFAQTSQGMVYVANDWLPFVADPTASGSQPKTGYTDLTDGGGTHWNVTSGYYIGRSIARIYNLLFPPLDLLPNNVLTFDPVNAPRANLLLNAMLNGTGGTVTAPPGGVTVTGTAPTSWTTNYNNLPSGITAAHSQVTSAISGLPMWQTALSGTYTAGDNAAYFRLIQQVSPAGVNNLAVGDTIEALIAFEIDAGNGIIARPKLDVRWNGSSNFNTDGLDDVGFYAPEAISGVLRVPVHTYIAGDLPVSVGNLQLTAYTMLQNSTTGSGKTGTIRYGRPVLQKVDAI